MSLYNVSNVIQFVDIRWLLVSIVRKVMWYQSELINVRRNITRLYGRWYLWYLPLLVLVFLCTPAYNSLQELRNIHVLGFPLYRNTPHMRSEAHTSELQSRGHLVW